ncbi:hypothetical protein DZF79_02950 [Vibrio parahaemolyticus]|nr:hypothetical protein [Vibrio parahaemolyticus]
MKINNPLKRLFGANRKKESDTKAEGRRPIFDIEKATELFIQLEKEHSYRTKMFYFKSSIGVAFVFYSIIFLSCIKFGLSPSEAIFSEYGYVLRAYGSLPVSLTIVSLLALILAMRDKKNLHKLMSVKYIEQIRACREIRTYANNNVMLEYLDAEQKIMNARSKPESLKLDTYQLSLVKDLLRSSIDQKKCEKATSALNSAHLN